VGGGEGQSPFFCTAPFPPSFQIHLLPLFPWNFSSRSPPATLKTSRLAPCLQGSILERLSPCLPFFPFRPIFGAGLPKRPAVFLYFLSASRSSSFSVDSRISHNPHLPPLFWFVSLLSHFPLRPPYECLYRLLFTVLLRREFHRPMTRFSSCGCPFPSSPLVEVFLFYLGGFASVSRHPNACCVIILLISFLL